MTAKTLRLFLCVFCVAAVAVSAAQTLTTLASFNGANGYEPYGGVIQGSDGNFYGTTYIGGANGSGNVFKITPTGQLTSLYSFCSLSNCADGSQPTAPLIQGSDGNLYGTTLFHGLNGGGTIFKISLSGNFTTIYNFCSISPCKDGAGPYGGLVLGSDGNFYGTTYGGGYSVYGTIFQFKPSGVLTTLYSFCAQSGCPDGSEPESALVQGMDGTLYGTTNQGGNIGNGGTPAGTVFKITTSGTFTQLYKFCSQADCTDGANPYGGLTLGTDGNLYGTTYYGGTGCEFCGTVFKITPNGSLTTLHGFCSAGGCGEGNNPYGPLVQATDGNFYGTAQGGGAGQSGTIFKISPTGNLTSLYTFCLQSGCPDGESPRGVLYFGTDGNFYGTTSKGGLDGDGTVFKFAAGISLSAVQFVPVTPCRLVDTRQTQNPIQGGTYQNFAVSQLGGCNIPTSATAYSLNVTVIPQGALGYLTIWPSGRSQPVVSTMNSLDGRTKADAAIVGAGASGAVSVFATNTANLVLDIDGYFAVPGGSTLAFYPLAPCRVADTRKSNFPQGLGTPHLSAAVARDFPVLESTCIPSGVNAAAYSFNFTAIPYPSLGSALAYLEVWPKGEQPEHPVSTLNNSTGTYVANAAIVPAGSSGEITAYASNDTDLAIDINGYFAAPGPGGLSLYPTLPCRVIDTRKIGNGQPFNGALNPPVDVVDSSCGVPNTAAGYVFNATVVPSPNLSYLTLWPDGEGQPVVSTLNAVDGWITSNMAIVPNANGKVDAYAAGLTQLILDISGYFAP